MGRKIAYGTLVAVHTEYLVLLVRIRMPVAPDGVVVLLRGVQLQHAYNDTYLGITSRFFYFYLPFRSVTEHEYSIALMVLCL